MKQLQTSCIGESCQKRPLTLFTPSAEVGRLNTLFLGVFHGDEGLSGKLLQAFLTHLRTADALLPAVPLGPELSFGIIPVVNPDGLATKTRVNAHGVDLNRNFPTANWICENENTPYYSGPHAGSEPETQALIRLIEQTQPKKIISIHTPYRVVNYDGPAEPLAQMISGHTGYPVTADIGYPTPGSFGTYCGVERQIQTITLELPEDEPLEQIVQANLQSLTAAIAF